MGGAFSAIADDATATFWNPAGLPWIGHQEATALHADLYGSGIQNNFASFVLPLTRSQAAAADWSQLGIDDTELRFGESRVDLAYGRKFGDRISAGATFRYLQRHTDLDGETVRQGSGPGVDFGLLLRPIESLRLSAVAQDAFDTKVHYSSGEGTVVAYPRTTKMGVAFAPKPWGTVAADLDDRFHFGIELHPIDAVAIRSGVQTDFGGTTEGAVYSFGAGLRWSLFRFDYALVDHPDLGSTSDFGVTLAFNFNPSQIQIERVEARDIYSSLYRSYAREPFGTVRVKNLENTPVSARLRVFVPDLMGSPSEQEIVLRPRATEDLPLTAIFPDRIVGREGDRAVQVRVSTTYQSLHLPRTEEASARCVAYGPGAIDWSKGVDQAAAYVTTRDPMVESFAREAVLAVAPAGVTSGNRNVDFAAAIFDAVAALGVTYVPDPNNPYSTISDVPRAVDTVRYPRQTIANRTGDCDDTSVLFAALFGNVGIQTQFADVPGHIFLLVDTGLHERNRFALGVAEDRYVIRDDEVWIPLETTALSKGFAEAWRIGAESCRGWDARGQLQLVDVLQAQSRFEPGVAGGALPSPTLDMGSLQAGLVRDLGTIAAQRESYLIERYGKEGSALQPTAEALNEIARLAYSAGRFAEAQAELERAVPIETNVARTRNNLGAVLAAAGDLPRAAESFRVAAGADSVDPGVWLNLGIACYAAGDSTGAELHLMRGLDLSGGYLAACALLGIAPEGEPTREGTARMTAQEGRDLLRAALRRVPLAASRERAAAAPAVRPAASLRPWVARSAGGRSAERAVLADLLYWKQ